MDIIARCWPKLSQNGLASPSNATLRVKRRISVQPVSAAAAMKGDREKCLEAGMNDYITKPVDAGALAKVLEKWLPEGAEKG
jgi:CheY-like chemotaxis protein